MNIAKLAFVLLFLALVYVAAVESRGKKNSRYRLFKSRLHRSTLGEGRQYRQDVPNNRKDKLNENDIKENNVDDDYENSIDDELNSLALDPANRFFFFNKYGTTTAAPIINNPTTTFVNAPPAPPPAPPLPPAPTVTATGTATAPATAPAVPGNRSFRHKQRRHRYKDFDY